MNIGLIHTSFRVSGGAETTSMYILDALKKTNHLTTLYTVEPPMIRESNNFKIHKIKRMNLPSLWRYQRMKEVQKMFKDSSSEDVLVIGSGNLTLEKTSVKKIILYCHSTFEAEREFLQKSFPRLKMIYYRRIQKNIKLSFERLKDQSVRLVANSNYTKKTIFDNFQKDSKIIYPPVNIKKFSKWFDHPKKNKIITLSRFSPEKNLKFAIDVIGSGSSEYQLIGNAKFESQVKIYNNLKNYVDPKKITVSCNLSDHEVEDSLSSSKVYFQPSKETFGIAVIEAISAGCIPIVPNDFSFVETVPFGELRFNGEKEALNKLEEAVAGKYDFLRPKLKTHIEKYSVENFQNSILKEIESTN